MAGGNRGIGRRGGVFINVMLGIYRPEPLPVCWIQTIKAVPKFMYGLGVIIRPAWIIVGGYIPYFIEAKGEVIPGKVAVLII